MTRLAIVNTGLGVVRLHKTRRGYETRRDYADCVTGAVAVADVVAGADGDRLPVGVTLGDAVRDAVADDDGELLRVGSGVADRMLPFTGGRTTP